MRETPPLNANPQIFPMHSASACSASPVTPPHPPRSTRSVPRLRWLLLATIFCASLSALPPSARADDWPQWLGPQRDSVWREKGIIDRIPAGGLTVKWRAPVGLGYAGPAVANGKVYIMDYAKNSGNIVNNPGNRVVLDGMERVLCFSAANGELLWKHEYERPYSLSYPSGPRATPAVADGKVYALGAEGTFTCLDAENGAVLWSRDFKKEYKVKTPIWGFSSHPLVEGDTVYCLAGGEGSVALALDKNTGVEKWRALSAPEPGYCPPTMIEHGGTRQLLIWHPESLNSLDPATGELYWSVPLKPAYSMSIAAPRLLGDRLFTSGMGRVGVMLRLTGSNPPAVEEVWRGLPKTAVYSVNSTPFFEDGVIYGCNGDNSTFIACRASDGERLWSTTEPTLAPGQKGRHGTAFIVKHEEHGLFFLFSESGDLILADLSPDGYKEISRENILEPTNEVFGRPCVWSHPAFAEKSVFARNDKELVCVSLAE